MKRVSRRWVLRGIGGVAISLPLLESFRPRSAQASDATPPFVIFFRQANGVACANNNNEIGSEPERFWPQAEGPLTASSVAGRALDELSAHLGSLLVVGNVNMNNFNYGDGHARGALQGLTARGPTVEDAAGNSEAAGPSIDHFIGEQLHPGKDSLFLYAGKSGGWLGGPCISYRSSGMRRSAIHDPWNAYQTIVGGNTSLPPEARKEIVDRQKSINDLVRGQLTDLMGSPKLSSVDKQRLQLHFDSVRDLELALSCKLAQDAEALLQGESPGFDSSDGHQVIKTTKQHMQLAALAVACGHTQSVAIQIGSGNDGANRYPDKDGQLMADNFHYISHRRKSHDSNGSIIPGSDLLHHQVDREFAKMFKFLLDELSKFSAIDGKPLLEKGLAVWYNDNGTGPGHSSKNIPVVIGGSAHGLLKQGQYIKAGGGSEANHAKLLNTIASAVGVRKASGALLDDFGDPSLPKGQISEIMV